MTVVPFFLGVDKSPNRSLLRMVNGNDRVEASGPETMASRRSRAAHGLSPGIVTGHQRAKNACASHREIAIPLIDAYLGIVAATNFKQRTRKMMEYYYADRYHYAVAGTPNRLEYDQGFFVKNGDGAADFKPIAHLYKSQVYQLAEYLDVPHEIQRRTPTTDTYSLEQSQEEFYFSMPLRTFDLCLYGKNRGFSPEEIAALAGLTCTQVQAIFAAIDSKRKATAYLHRPPVLIEDIADIRS